MLRTTFFILLMSALAIGCADQCEETVCLNGGECKDGSCECPDLTTGEWCQITADCFDVNCQNGGTCVADTCQCPPGWLGALCQTADPCFNVTCEPWEECFDGNCECPVGYEGVNCEIMIRSKFLGHYLSDGTLSCPSSGTFGVSDFEIDIYAASSPEKVIMDFESIFVVLATASGDSLIIDRQFSDDFYYTGTAWLNGNQLSMGIAREFPNVETCSYILTAY